MKKGDRIRLSCKGKSKGCPLGTKKLKVKKGKRSLSLVVPAPRRQAAQGRGARGAGDASGAPSALRRSWTIRAPKDVLSKSRCLRPGKKKPCPLLSVSAAGSG